MKMDSFKDLIVWQKSIVLIKLVYSITAQFPVVERYGLVSQMRRSAVSIPSNISEGYGRGYRKEYIQFMAYAYGSATELETQILLAKEFYRELNYTEAEKLLIEVQKMLSSIIVRLRA